MNPDQTREETLFNAARALTDPKERAVFLDAACKGDPALRRGVEALLAAQAKGDAYFDRGAQDPGLDLTRKESDRSAGADSPASEKPGDRIGRYKLREKIGEGGCGIVYVAEQEEPVRRRVALKVIKLGMDTRQVVARFEAERQALALMDHPNIAKIFDAGIAESPHPASGHPLPSSDEGRGQGEGSHSLATRHSPLATHYGRPYFVIREVEPPRPSTRLSTLAYGDLTTVAIAHGSEAPKLVSLIRGDLDWIVMKALEKDRTRRYETANGLAMDLKRHLNNEPVVARPPSAVYRFQRLARRNKLAFAAAGAIAGVLVLGIVASTGQAVRATRAQRNEEAQRQLAQAQTKLAEENRHKAERSELEAERNLYAAHMNLAQQYWEQSNIDGLRQLLEATQESPDRGFEWYYWQRQTHLASKTLRGHLEAVIDVAISTDGQRIVTGSADQTAKVWDASSGRVLLTLKDHRHRIVSVAYSPNGQWIVTGSLDQTAMVWEAATGRRVHTLQGHTAGIGCVAFSPDSQRIVTSGGDPTARVWDVASGQELLKLEGHRTGMQSVAFSPDGQRIVTGSYDGTAKVWEAATGRELLTFKGDIEGILAVTFSPDSRRIVTGEWNNTAKVRDVDSGRELLTLHGHSDRIWSVAFSPDGGRIVTSSPDQTAKVWDALSGTNLLTLKGHSAGVQAVVFSSDGQRIITGSHDRTAMVWDAAIGRELPTLNGHSAWINSVAFSPNGERILTGSSDQTAKVWDALSGTNLLTLRGHSAPIWSLAFSANGEWIVTGSGDHTVKVWDAVNGTNPLTLEGHSAPIWSVAFSPNGQRIVSGSSDKTAKVWDALNGTNLYTLEGHGGPIWSVAFSPNGQRIITGGDDQTAKVWDAVSGTNLLTLRGHSAPIWSVAFSPNGQRIITGSDDQTAKVWEAVSGRPLLTLKGHSAGIKSAAFSPDGERIVTGGDDQTAKVWHAAQAGQVAAWQEEERAAAQYLAALQRERTAKQERQQLAHARDEGAIKRWLLLAPITLATNQSGTQGLDVEQIQGEGRLQPKAGDGTVTVNGKMKWQEVIQRDYVIDFNNLLRHDKCAPSVAYAVCYIRSETEQRGLQMLVGSDDEAKVYLNGKQIYQWPFARSFVADMDTVRDITLNPGLNVLVFKVVNELGDWQGSIRFTDAQGNPVKGIKVTLEP